MARIDDYNQAFELARAEVSGRDPDLLASYAGAAVERDEKGEPRFSLTFLNQDLVSPWPEMTFANRASREDLPVQQQVFLMHYLQGAWNSNGAPVTGSWIAFQEVPDGRFYLDAFMKRAKVPLVKAFGSEPEQLVKIAARAYGAEPSDHGDISVKIRALPLVPIALILWKGDDEFPPEGNVLFDGNISKILSAEDIAWLAGAVVYPLMGMVKTQK
jgi:hypothetical protein